MNKMNLPNKLTIARIILTPILIFFMILKYSIWNIFLYPFYYFIVLLLFIIIALTDFLDGYIARRDNIVTDLGKLLDPIADKIFVFSILIVFVRFNMISTWLVLLLLAREFVVVAIRTLVAEKNSKILQANDFAKFKTAAQMISITFILLIGFSKILNTVTMLPAFILSMMSMFSYIKEVKSHLNNEIGEDNGV